MTGIKHEGGSQPTLGRRSRSEEPQPQRSSQRRRTTASTSGMPPDSYSLSATMPSSAPTLPVELMRHVINLSLPKGRGSALLPDILKLRLVHPEFDNELRRNAEFRKSLATEVTEQYLQGGTARLNSNIFEDLKKLQSITLDCEDMTDINRLGDVFLACAETSLLVLENLTITETEFISLPWSRLGGLEVLELLNAHIENKWPLDGVSSDAFLNRFTSVNFHMPSMTSFRLEQKETTSWGASFLNEFVRQNPQITSLNLMRSFLSNSEMASLPWKNLHHLEELYLGDNHIGYDTLHNIANMSQKDSEGNDRGLLIHTLNIDGFEVRSQGHFTGLSELLSRVPHLRRFSMVDGSFREDEEFQIRWESMPLVDVSLYDCAISEGEVGRLIRSCGQTLECLDLGRIGFLDGSQGGLSSFDLCPKLRTLSLRNTTIEDSHVHLINISAATSLDYLDLADTYKLTEQGLLRLGLDRMSKLRVLDISGRSLHRCNRVWEQLARLANLEELLIGLPGPEDEDLPTSTPFLDQSDLDALSRLAHLKRLELTYVPNLYECVTRLLNQAGPELALILVDKNQYHALDSQQKSEMKERSKRAGVQIGLNFFGHQTV